MNRIQSALSLLVTLILSATPLAHADNACQIVANSQQDRYNEVMQATCHNCYENDVARAMGASNMAQVLDKVKNIELDFWDTRDAVFGGKPGHWFVRHNPGTIFQSGNDNICSGNGSGTNNLAACLTDIKNWSDAHPNHSVITIFLDKKQAWSSVSEGRRPSDLDRLINAKFGTKLYKPAMLQQNFPSLRLAATNNGWPLMSELKGKIIVVLNGGQTFNHNDTQNAYIEERKQNASIFVGPDADEQSDVLGTPNQFSNANAQQVVFYNLAAKNDKSYLLGNLTRGNKYVARLWGGEALDVCTMRRNCVNNLAFYKWSEASCNGVTQGKLQYFGN